MNKSKIYLIWAAVVILPLVFMSYTAEAETDNNRMADSPASVPEAAQIDIEHIDLPASFRGTTDNHIIGAEHLNAVFRDIARNDTVVRILQIGDSHVRGHSFPLAIRHYLEDCFGAQATGDDTISYKTECIASETGENGIVFHAIGINGATASSFMGEAMLDRIADIAPEVVVVSFGTNESHGKYSEESHTSSLDSLVSRIRERCPDVTFLMTTPPGSYIKVRTGRTYRDRRGRRRYSVARRPNDRTARVAANIVKYGQDNGIAVWDMFSIAGGGRFACSNWKSAGLMNRDQIHYSADGYRLQGKLLGEAFIKAYNDYVGH